MQALALSFSWFGLDRLRARAVVIGVVALVVGTAHVAQAGINVWTSHGPYGGDVLALAIDPSTPSTLYAGTAERCLPEHQQRRQLERGQHRPEPTPLPSTRWPSIRPRRARSTPGPYGRRLPEHRQRRQLERGQHRPEPAPRRHRAGHRSDHAEHALRRDRWRRCLPEHQQRRQLERGQHRPERLSLHVTALAIDPTHAEHALRRDRLGRASSRAPTAAAAGARSTPA